MWTQFTEMSWAVKYIMEAVYHHFMVGREGSGEEREGTVVLEMQEAGVGTSEVPEGGHEGTKDWGECLSRLTAADKGKGKEVQGGDFTGGVESHNCSNYFCIKELFLEECNGQSK